MIEEKPKNKADYYIGVGLCLGGVFGAAFNNVGLGICLGLVFGISMQKRKSNTQGSHP